MSQEDEDAEYESEDEDEKKKKSSHVNWLEIDKKAKEPIFSANIVHFLPKWMETANLGYWLNHPEYVVFDENQVRIKYILQLRTRE